MYTVNEAKITQSLYEILQVVYPYIIKAVGSGDALLTPSFDFESS
jgi:hypothetical protein